MHPAPDTHDVDLQRLLDVTADTDRSESPFGWSDLPTTDTPAGTDA
ncbi:hypothetical protein [Streptomyces sp. KAU_LT]|nr:hypothetical protein [Streptomyces sp. KAU_LT]MDI9836231.1 hypothetical protein [Streptomyces sp. KAU_LT]